MRKIVDLRELGVVEEEAAEEVDGAPVAAVERGGIGTGGNGVLEGGSHSTQWVRQNIVLRAHHRRDSYANWSGGCWIGNQISECVTDGFARYAAALFL